MITLRKPAPGPLLTAESANHRPDSTASLYPHSTNWGRPFASRHLNGWIIDRLHLQPYQHILEIGFGPGRLLEEAARTLRIGFLAGVEPSTPLYQQAYRRNKRFIARQLMQLHLGELQDLPYPPHYFHTVYSTSAILSSKYPVMELLRLIRLLRSGGRLVLLFQPKAARNEGGILPLTQRIQQDYIVAGLLRPETELRETSFGAALAITGFTA